MSPCSLGRWADISDDKYSKVALAFLHRKKRLGMMIKLLTKLITSSSKVRLSVGPLVFPSLAARMRCFLGGDETCVGRVGAQELTTA